MLILFKCVCYNFNSGTRRAVVCILARLMDTNNAWKASDFYKEMETFFSNKRLRIFSTVLCGNIMIHVPLNSGYVMLPLIFIINRLRNKYQSQWIHLPSN